MNHQTGDSRSTPDPTQPGAATGASAVAAAVTSAVESGVKVGNRQAATSKGTASPLSPPRVTIIVPAYNQAEMTEKCLYSLAANTGDEPNYRVVVIDNGSTDWTMYLLHAMEGDIEVVSNDTNLGFAEACNQGAEWAQASDYLLFLNNDTEPRQHWLEAMVDLADSDPKIGIVGAKLLYPGTGRVQHAGLVMQGGTPQHIYRGVDQNDPRVLVERDLDMVTGACLLVRTEIFTELGGFDSEYINGVEDVDLCLRARECGWRVVYCPDAVLEHHEGSSEGRFDHVSENLNRFREKWRGRFAEDGTLTVREEAAIRLPLDDESIGSAGSLSERGASEAGEAFRGESIAHEYLRSSAMPTPTRSDVVRGDWEGDFFLNSSLAHVNREMSLALLATGRCELGLNSGAAVSTLLDEEGARYPALAARVDRLFGEAADFHLKHRWPPDFNRPADSHFVLLQPWEFGSIPKTWVEPLRRNVDQVWAPSTYVRDCYIESGVDASKVALVPQGVDPSRFRPGLDPLHLPTEKSFVFLFVGGTVRRKGIDLLLDAYCQSFGPDDDVCLVIKDIGMNSFYRGMNAGNTIRKLQANPACPEILYITDDLSARDVPKLYAAANALVHPYRGEGFGLLVAEAMACGLPVIVTKGGACDDFCPEDLVYSVSAERVNFDFNEETVGQAWVLEPDLDALKERLHQVVSQTEEGRLRGQKASDYIRTNFTWERAAWTAIEILEGLRESQPAAAIGGKRRRAAIVTLDGNERSRGSELVQIFGRYGCYDIDATHGVGCRLNEIHAGSGDRDVLAIISASQVPPADTVHRLFHHLDIHDTIGMIVPDVSGDPAEKPDPNSLESGDAALTDVDYPAPECPVFVRLEAVQAVGGFDESFQTRAALANLARLLRRAGWRVVAAADCHANAQVAPVGQRAELMAIALLEEGDALRDRGDLASAIDTYRRAFQEKDDYVEAILVLADALVEQGEVEEAVEVIGRLVALDPESAWAHNATGLVLSRSNPMRARTCFSTATQLQPDFVEAHVNLGVLEWEEGDVEAAFAAFQHVSRLDPANRELAINLALIYAQIDRRDESIELLADCLRRHGDDDLELNLNYS